MNGIRFPTIEVGCGDVLDRRFDVRLDIKQTPATTHVGDMRKMELPSNTFAYLKSAATLEHVSPADQDLTVKEFYRILIPGGIAWIQTPDLFWIETAYIDGLIDKDWHDTLMRGGQRDEYDYHLGLLNADRIELLFQRNGFRVIQKRTGFDASGSLDYAFERLP